MTVVHRDLGQQHDGAILELLLDDRADVLIENFAPERTETRSGLSGSQKPLPVFSSSSFMWATMSSQSPGGSSLPAA